MSTQVTIQLSPTGRFKPGRTQGDGEFFGHGPQVNVTAQLYAVGQKLFLKHNATFQETSGKGSDNTRFEGSETREVYDVASRHPGQQLISIRTPVFDQFQYVDTDISVDEFPRGPDGLINRLEIQGDRTGVDDPWIYIIFNPAVLELSN